eukprot:6427551-Lingulodinium_polyedra.AAC.1
MHTHAEKPTETPRNQHTQRMKRQTHCETTTKPATLRATWPETMRNAGKFSARRGRNNASSQQNQQFCAQHGPTQNNAIALY